MLDDVGISRTSVNQLAARVINEAAVGKMAGPELHLLCECAGIRSLVTFNAARIVVGWSQAVANILTLREYELIVFESAISPSCRGNGVGAAGVYCSAARAEIVEEVIGLGIHVSSECFTGALTFNLGCRHPHWQCECRYEE